MCVSDIEVNRTRYSIVYITVMSLTVQYIKVRHAKCKIRDIHVDIVDDIL